MWLKRTFATWNRLWAERYLVPQFDAVGEGLVVYNPQYVEVTGHRVRLGRHVHMIATRDAPIRLTVHPGDAGEIEIGDCSVINSGVRVASAASIRTGSNCLLAGYCYLSDADWHDLYDRTSAPGSTRPIRLGDNVWIGDSAIVCKGVTIGDNSIVGTGSVVASDLPANVIAVGNPARVVKELDPKRELVRRETLFNGEMSWAEYVEGYDRWVLTPNTLRVWLRSKLAPTRDL